MTGKQQHRPKHVPQRTCVACRSKFDKKSLTRVVHTPDGLVIDDTGKRSGRGAYLCNDVTCWQRANTTSILDKALRVRLREEDKTVLTTRLSNPS
ncbi:MAG: YlxR family protein [Chloroflexota bacterium]